MLAEIKAILEEQLIIEENYEITEDTRIMEDLGADSLDVLELLNEVEEKYQIEFDRKKIKEIHTVKDIISYINEEKNG